MTQFDFGTIDTSVKTGTQLGSDLNNWRDALHSSHKGPTPPAYAVAGMVWMDDSVSPDMLVKVRSEDNTVWLTKGIVSNSGFIPYRNGVALPLPVENAGGVPSILADVFVNRPVAGNAGLLFLATDTGRLYRDNGATWDRLVGGSDGWTFAEVSGTYVKPDGLELLEGWLIGPGGGGGASEVTGNAAGGGGGGGATYFKCPEGLIPSTLDYTVGTGGLGGTTGPATNGQAGSGPTYFGDTFPSALAYAGVGNGGERGVAGIPRGIGGAGGIGGLTNGLAIPGDGVRIRGADGHTAAPNAGSGVPQGPGGNGGDAAGPFGGGGAEGNIDGTGFTSFDYGGGGGGAATQASTAAGGAGGDGLFAYREKF